MVTVCWYLFMYMQLVLLHYPHFSKIYKYVCLRYLKANVMLFTKADNLDYKLNSVHGTLF
jgi:hypothetical protein